MRRKESKENLKINVDLFVFVYVVNIIGMVITGSFIGFIIGFDDMAMLYGVFLAILSQLLAYVFLFFREGERGLGKEVLEPIFIIVAISGIFIGFIMRLNHMSIIYGFTLSMFIRITAAIMAYIFLFLYGVIIEKRNNMIKAIKRNIEFKKYFPIVPASTLSTEDKAFKYEPRTRKQKVFKDRLFAAIESGLSDFRAQKIDPSLDDKGNIYFSTGMEPAVGESLKCWKVKAENYMPKKGSRLGTKEERIAFLGLLIKYLVEEKNYTVEDAWESVCDDSKDLGHYKDSENAKHNFESTGSRKIGEWYDLANTYKITAGDEVGCFSIFGGYYYDKGCNNPLVEVDVSTLMCVSVGHEKNGVAWIVMDV